MYRRKPGRGSEGRGRSPRSERYENRDYRESSGEHQANRHYFLRHLIEFLVTHLVSDKDAVVIYEKDRQGRVHFDIKVAKNDMGKILGRNGKTINSIRNVVRAAATKVGSEVIVDVMESAD